MVATAGMQIFLQSLRASDGSGAGVFMSPLSIVYALTLALNAAGECQAVRSALGDGGAGWGQGRGRRGLWMGE